MVTEVVGRLAEVHGLEGVAGGDALIESGEDSHPQRPGQGGLTNKQASEGALGIELGVRQETQFFELFGGQEMGFVDLCRRRHRST